MGGKAAQRVVEALLSNLIKICLDSSLIRSDRMMSCCGQESFCLADAGARIE